MIRREFLAGVILVPTGMRSPNVYSMVPHGQLGVIWRDFDGEWHPACFGGAIYNTISILLPRREWRLAGGHAWSGPDVLPVPESLFPICGHLLCTPKNQRSDFLPVGWRP